MVKTPSGCKSGTVPFIRSTQGEWIGVALKEPESESRSVMEYVIYMILLP